MSDRLLSIERFVARNYGRVIFYGSSMAAIVLAKMWEPRVGMMLFCIAFLSLAQQHDASRKKADRNRIIGTSGEQS